jgi:hypothetical protein
MPATHPDNLVGVAGIVRANAVMTGCVHDDPPTAS